MSGEIIAILSLVAVNIGITATALYFGLRNAGLKEELGEVKLAKQKVDEQAISLSKDYSTYRKGCEEQKRILRKAAKDLETELLRHDTPASVLERLNGLFSKAPDSDDDEGSGVPESDSGAASTPKFEL